MLRSVLSAARLLELPDLSRLCIEYMRQLIKLDSVVGMAKFLSCADGASEAGGVGVALQDLKDGKCEDDDGLDLFSFANSCFCHVMGSCLYLLVQRVSG